MSHCDVNASYVHNYGSQQQRVMNISSFKFVLRFVTSHDRSVFGLSLLLLL